MPRKKPLRDFVPPTNCLVVYKSKGTVDSDIICESFLQRILVPHILRKNIKNPILLLDQAKCDMSLRVKLKLAENNIRLELVPPRMTGIVQPADVCWFSSLKKHYHRLWSEWFQNDPKAFTKSGNLKSPGYQMAIGWISLIWRYLNFEIIKNRFDMCGITTSDHKQFNKVLISCLNGERLRNVLEETNGEQ